MEVLFTHTGPIRKFNGDFTKEGVEFCEQFYTIMDKLFTTFETKAELRSGSSIGWFQQCKMNKSFAAPLNRNYVPHYVGSVVDDVHAKAIQKMKEVMIVSNRPLEDSLATSERKSKNVCSECSNLFFSPPYSSNNTTGPTSPASIESVLDGVQMNQSVLPSQSESNQSPSIQNSPKGSTVASTIIKPEAHKSVPTTTYCLNCLMKPDADSARSTVFPLCSEWFSSGDCSAFKAMPTSPSSGIDVNEVEVSNTPEITIDEPVTVSAADIDNVSSMENHVTETEEMFTVNDQSEEPNDGAEEIFIDEVERPSSPLQTPATRKRRIPSTPTSVFLPTDLIKESLRDIETDLTQSESVLKPRPKMRPRKTMLTKNIVLKPKPVERPQRIITFAESGRQVHVNPCNPAEEMIQFLEASMESDDLF